MIKLVRFIAAFLIYAVIDIVWNILPPVMSMYKNLHAASGSPWEAIGKTPDAWGVAEGLSILVFFLLIAFANSYLAVEPAIRENSLFKAMKNSVILGCAAYATYIVPIFFTIANWPGILVPIDIIIGGCLSLITSTAVTAVALRMRKS